MLVDLETPYGSLDPEIRHLNRMFARACTRDCVLRGELPFASHLLYTQPGILDDKIPAERDLGIKAGKRWTAVAEKTVVYLDRGISRGMHFGIADAQEKGRLVEYRELGFIPDPDVFGDPKWMDR